MAEHKVRTTIRPEEELIVGDAEYTDLRLQGLLVETSATTDEGVRKAAEKQVAERNTVTEGK